MNNVEIIMPKAKGKIQNDRLFIRGNAMSGAPTCIGIKPVCQAYEGRHNGTKNHDQAMISGHLIKEFWLLQTVSRVGIAPL